MVSPRQGEIWWAEAEDKRRPVLVVTRTEAVLVRDWITIAPVTRRQRGIPTEIALGAEEGLRHESVAAFDSLQPIRKAFLVERAGELADPRFSLCQALAAVADC